METFVYQRKELNFDIFPSDLSKIPDSFIRSLVAIVRKWESGTDSFEFQTSGSTGTPRVIQFSRKQLIASAKQTIDFFHLKEGDTLFSCLPFAHIAGYMMVIRCLVNRMKLVVAEPSSMPFHDLREEQPIDFTAVVPIQLIKTIEEEPEKIRYLNQMKAIIVGGGRIPEKLSGKINEIKAPAYETFGMTETLSHLALRRINGENPEKFFSPLKEVKIRVDDRGCLVVKSPVTNDREIYTNDCISINNDNTFDWTGRFDNIVNSGGIKIQIEKLEEKIRKIFMENDISDEFFIYKIKDETWGESIAMVIESEDKDQWGRSLKDLLMKSLTAFEVPRKIDFSGSFEYTLLGKLNKTAILASVMKI